MFHLGQKRISCIQLGQQLLDMTCGTSGWRENAERKKYWLVNYWKVQREPMGKVAKELKNNVGWGNRDMPENLVVGLETSTMLESHRGLKIINIRKITELKREPWKAKTEESSLLRMNQKRAWWCISKKLWPGSAFKGAGEPEPFFCPIFLC